MIEKKEQKEGRWKEGANEGKGGWERQREKDRQIHTERI